MFSHLAALVLSLTLLLSVVADKDCTYTSKDETIARYLFELWNNRQSKCESGGDFLRDPKEISYSVKSFCQSSGPGGTTFMTPTYSYKNCKSKKIESLTLQAAVKNCAENGNNPVLNPFKYNVAKVQKMPAGYTCPSGFEQVKIESDPDKDFTREWEFRHAVENVYKYGNNTSTGGSLAPLKGCNAYVSTTTDKACYNAKSSQYQGYATIRVECLSNGKAEKIPVYIDATDLGRSKCPWPEFLENSPGYDPNFRFINSSASTTSPTASVTQAKPSSGLQSAISCIQKKKIAIITSGPELILKSQVWNKLNDTNIALAIVEPETTEQVSGAMDCLFSNGVPAIPKSGGHSYDGYSVLPTAVTVDFSKMRSVKLNNDNTATVQGGARLGMIYYQVWTQSAGKRGAVGGTCPAVGVGGHVLGGGIGFLNRMYGLACDQLVSLTMVNFKGEVLQVSAKENSDIFWASCGGGGGNFGIVTEFKLNTVPVPPKVTYFTFKVTKGAVDYLVHLQNTVSKVADPRIGGLQVNPESKNSVANEGLFLGTSAELDAALKTSQLSTWATNLKKKEMTWIDSVIQFAGSDMGNRKLPKDMMDIDYIETVGRDYFNLNSLYVLESNPLPASAFQDMLDWIQNNPDGFVEFDLLGPKGQVSKVKPTDSAYDYRNALYSLQYGNEWLNPKRSNNLIAQTQLLTAKMDKYYTTKTPPRVINYLDVQTPSMVGYYGSNLPRLRSIKTKYDPLNYFSWPLSIPPTQGKLESEAAQEQQQEEQTDGQSHALTFAMTIIPWMMIMRAWM